jgi:glycosyltransferase involved in cell wall biosynthesis
MVAISRIEAHDLTNAQTNAGSKPRRFDHVLITSVFGDPLHPRTWSGAPLNLATALSKQGVSVAGLNPHIGKIEKLLYAARHMVSGYGHLRNTAQILRELPARRQQANQVEDTASRLGAQHVMHTGTLDLPALNARQGVKHYLYCDHTWALSHAYRASVDGSSDRALREYEKLEADSYAQLDHIFTFGAYVRDNIIAHYGVPADRVTAVGSGMGQIEPYFGTKTYSQSGRMLFVAKHLFHEKGGDLVVEAFMSLRQKHPEMHLTIVGDEKSRRFIPVNSGIEFRPRVAWNELQQLFRDATLLVQPMLNDPWGQVYLEALASRTPVLGLNRNGLPEITSYGRYGFLADRAEPAAIAEAMVEALSDPDRLSWMGIEGQRHVLRHYSWDTVATKVLAD